MRKLDSRLLSDGRPMNGGLERSPRISALRSNRFAALPPPGFRVRISSKRLHHATP